MPPKVETQTGAQRAATKRNANNNAGSNGARLLGELEAEERRWFAHADAVRARAGVDGATMEEAMPEALRGLDPSIVLEVMRADERRRFAMQLEHKRQMHPANQRLFHLKTAQNCLGRMRTIANGGGSKKSRQEWAESLHRGGLTQTTDDIAKAVDLLVELDPEQRILTATSASIRFNTFHASENLMSDADSDGDGALRSRIAEEMTAAQRLLRAAFPLAPPTPAEAAKDAAGASDEKKANGSDEKEVELFRSRKREAARLLADGSDDEDDTLKRKRKKASTADGTVGFSTPSPVRPSTDPSAEPSAKPRPPKLVWN